MTRNKLVYEFDFDHQLDEGDRRVLYPPQKLRDLLGGKGAYLSRMTKLALEMPPSVALNVPPGFVISTRAYRLWREQGEEGISEQLKSEIAEHVEILDKKAEGLFTPYRKPPASDLPLLVSVRSGARRSMPGMLDTVLNVGLPAVPTSDDELRRMPPFVLDLYRRLLSSYARTVLEIDPVDFPAPAPAPMGRGLDKGELQGLVKRYVSALKKNRKGGLPGDALEQIFAAVAAVFRSYRGARAQSYRKFERLSEDQYGTAVSVQAMVFGNLDGRSGAGVAYSRDPSTGDRAMTGDFRGFAQGAEVVGGTEDSGDLDQLRQEAPDLYAELAQTLTLLEGWLKDICEVEFTFESGKLWVLQCRVPRRTGRAAVSIATDMVAEGALSKVQAVARVTSEDLERSLHTEIGAVKHREATENLIARGRAVSPGAVAGKAYFDNDKAREAKRAMGDLATSRSDLHGHECGASGVILVKHFTTSDDVEALEVVDGIVTLRSGFATHSMVLARSWNKPFVAGVGKRFDAPPFGQLALDDPTDSGRGEEFISEGDWITIDGTTGYVYRGDLSNRFRGGAGPVDAREKLLKWADVIGREGRLGIRANVDTPKEAREALVPASGAVGIGLCRTEVLVEKAGQGHLLEALLAAAPGSEQELMVLHELELLFVEQFSELYREASRNGPSPVAVRLFDRLTTAQFGPANREVAGEGDVNRGVRLAFMRPGVYEMQVKAVLTAAARCGRGNEPQLEIVVPFVIDPAEVRHVRDLVDMALADLRGAVAPVLLPDWRPLVGAMIETPRAVMLAGDFAQYCDFFSYGLNDLSDLVFGISVGDEELLHRYREKGFLEVDPVTSIDRMSVGTLVQRSIYAARKVKPQLGVGLAAEHARDRESVSFLYNPPSPADSDVRLRIDYLSVVPEALPVARLVAAQAVIDGESGQHAGGPPRFDPLGPPRR